MVLHLVTLCVPAPAFAAGGALVGGYNPAGWTGLGREHSLDDAFLLLWPSCQLGQEPIKLPKASEELASVAVVLLFLPDSRARRHPSALPGTVACRPCHLVN